MYIYKITNNLNNKIYIGYKSKTVEESESYYGSGTVIKAAIKKYGKDNFTKTILERDIVDFDFLKERERHYIKLYDSYNNGYNLTKGGDGIIGYKLTEEHKQKLIKSVKGKPLSKEHKQKLSESLQGKIISEETKEAIRKALTGRPRPEETKRKISEGNIGKIRSEETRRKIGAFQKGRTRSPHSEETKRKIGAANAISLLGKTRGPHSKEHGEAISKSLNNKPIIKCPHCDVQGNNSNGAMTRYHFDNCKQKS